MADIFRPPVIVNRREPGPFQVAAAVGQSLLLTTLAVVVAALPIGTQNCQAAPALQRVVVDTTHGTPKTLFADSQLPVGHSPAFAPIALTRNVVDTTHGQPITLQVIVAPPPIVNPVQLGPLKFWWQPPDTSRCTAKPLYADNQLPVGKSPAFAPIALTRTVVDTSRGQPITLQVIVPPAPIVNPVQLGPLRFWWQPPDTSISTAKALYSDVQLPVGDSPAWAPIVLSRTVVDTSKGVPETLLPAPPAPLPIGQASFVGLQRFWFQPADTSQSAPKVTYGDKIPPFVNPQFPTPDKIRPVVDTSKGSYGTVYPVVVIALPPGKVNLAYVQRHVWQVVDTSGSSKYLVSIPVSERAYTFTGFTFIAG